MRMLISFFFLLSFAFLSAYIAKQRGRDPVAWFILGVLLGIFSPILLYILKPLPSVETKEENEDIKLQYPQQDSPFIGYVEKEWYYLDKSQQQQGPVAFKVLKALWQEEKITPMTYIWTEGMEQWKRIREMPGFIENI